jgi:hypothetical protein
MTGRKVERSTKSVCEIEITPAMIAAGVSELAGTRYLDDVRDYEVCVSRVLFDALTAGGYVVLNDTLGS